MAAADAIQHRAGKLDGTSWRLAHDALLRFGRTGADAGFVSFDASGGGRDVQGRAQIEAGDSGRMELVVTQTRESRNEAHTANALMDRLDQVRRFSLSSFFGKRLTLELADGSSLKLVPE